jgi:RNA polymerase sigma-70 factor (ECF subfamily)
MHTSSAAQLTTGSTNNPPETTRPNLRLINGGGALRQSLAEVVASLYPHALRLTRNVDRARDLVQDTALRVLAFEHTFTPGTHFKAWVRQVMYSIFLSHCRRQRRERSALSAWISDPVSWSKELSDETQPPLLPGLRRALDNLPAGFTQTVVLVDIEEWSYRDAATALGVPVGTVMSRLHRARRLLGEQLLQAA